MTRRFDAIVVGAGQAGPSLAGRLTAAGHTVAMVERKLIGGTCVNNGCIPTKTLVASAHAAHLARRGADFGVGTGAVSVDMAFSAVLAHRRGLLDSAGLNRVLRTESRARHRQISAQQRQDVVEVMGDSGGQYSQGRELL